MRSVFVAILVSLSFLLAGCSDKKGDDEHAYTCPDGTTLDLTQFPDHENSTFNPLSKCPKAGGSTNSTSQAPNQLPTLNLTVSDDGGNVTNVTMLMGNLTFSAEGSSDPDGSITGIAVSVTDSNTTRTATLYDPATKAFKSATFKFDRPGVVNVTIAMVDDRAGFTVNQTKVFVNHLQPFSGGSMNFPAGLTGGLGDPCEAGSSDTAIVDAAYVKPASFVLQPGATFVEATATGEVEVQICSLPDADGARTGLSEVGTTVVTAPGTPLPAPTGIASYEVRGMATAPGGAMDGFVVVHYEPQAAAPAAEE